MTEPQSPDLAALNLLGRIDRLESIDEIRQLAAKYSLALDMRDSDAWVGLFPEDIKVSENQSGRLALKTWFDETMRQQFDGTLASYRRPYHRVHRP